MRTKILFVSLMIVSGLVTGVSAQYGIPVYAGPNVTVVYPPSPPLVIVERPPVEYVPSGPVTYLIAFKDNSVRRAVAYWVSDNILYYVAPDHQQKTAPLNTVDTALSERLNAEQNVSFHLPARSEKTELRRLLIEELNLVLETSDTSRGLVVRISDVYFNFNQDTLTPAAREKLAKIAGILVAYSGLSPHLEGYTDSIGGYTYNLDLSERRANAVRNYLISQGVPATSLTAVGLGKSDPVATNATAEGRRQNRRVEMLIPAAEIGLTTTSEPAE